MNKKFLKKIIAHSPEDLRLISACCSEGKVKISELKYLPKNKIFLLSLERYGRETGKKNIKINSICKFEFVDTVKSKNIDQSDKSLVLELLTIEFMKNKENCEINLIFSGNAYITLFTEIIEATLIDSNQKSK